MLNFTNVSLRRGRQLLIQGATFSLYRGEKVGIVGENGSGKSTLLALVRGELATDAGEFDRPDNLQLAHVAQESPSGERAAIEFVIDGDEPLRLLEQRIAAAEAANDGHRLGDLHAEYAAMGGYDARSRAATLMHGLGFSTQASNQSISSFSGGWRVRLALAQALMCPSDLLLLDEPTNHLDLDAILWLEEWLRQYAGTLLLISHDREFLDRIANRIVDISAGTARAWRGNYSEFELQRAAAQAQAQAVAERTQRQINHIQSFIDRFKAQASKARQAQSRIKALERLPRIVDAQTRARGDGSVSTGAIEFSFANPLKLPRPLLTLNRAAVGYDGDVPVLSNISLSVAPGDRLALLGRNGAGKSTLMKLLAGQLLPMSGERVEAPDLRIGYFAQHTLEQLNPARSALEHVRDLEDATRATEQQLRDFLASFGFRGDRVFEPVGPFSGGEKARLVLALVSWQKPNLLLLDEPTNHLDLEMRQALGLALQEYTGAVIFVSHDRQLLRLLADELWLVADGGAQAFDGDLDDYARWLAANSVNRATVEPATATKAESADERQRRRRDGAARRAATAQMRKELAKLEAELDKLAGQKQQLESQLAEADIHLPGARDRLAQTLKESGRVSVALEQTEARWMAAAEELQATESRLAAAAEE